MERLVTDLPGTTEIAQPLLADLEQWRLELPHHDGCQISFAIEPDECGSLRLAYHAATLLVCRAILRVFSNREANFGLGSSVLKVGGESDWQWHDFASNCAVSAVQFLTSLGPTHFQTFWAPCKCSFPFLFLRYHPPRNFPSRVLAIDGKPLRDEDRILSHLRHIPAAHGHFPPHPSGLFAVRARFEPCEGHLEGAGEEFRDDAIGFVED
jgi:hypothetical protein